MISEVTAVSFNNLKTIFESAITKMGKMLTLVSAIYGRMSFFFLFGDE